MPNAPCKGCSDCAVEPNCHMSCQKYLDFQQECRERLDGQAQERDYQSYRRDIRVRVEKANRRMKNTRYRNRMN